MHLPKKTVSSPGPRPLVPKDILQAPMERPQTWGQTQMTSSQLTRLVMLWTSSNGKNIPDVHDRLKACCKDWLTAQTSSSPIRFKKNVTVESDEHGQPQQREWKFISFPPTGEKIHISKSGFKLNLHPCPKEQQKTWTTQFPKMEKEDI